MIQNGGPQAHPTFSRPNPSAMFPSINSLRLGGTSLRMTILDSRFRGNDPSSSKLRRGKQSGKIQISELAEEFAGFAVVCLCGVDLVSEHADVGGFSIYTYSCDEFFARLVEVHTLVS